MLSEKYLQPMTNLKLILTASRAGDVVEFVEASQWRSPAEHRSLAGLEPTAFGNGS